MTEPQVDAIRAELLTLYPGSKVIVSEDMREVIAEIGEGTAVAVIERSGSHFHLTTREAYRVLRGTLRVSSAGQGYVVREGTTITIEPGQIHFAVADGDPAWIEVTSNPPWSPSDHFIM